MSPTKRQIRKRDQTPRPGRGESMRFKSEQQPKAQRSSSRSISRNNMQRKDERAPYNLRSSQHHCLQYDCHCMENRKNLLEVTDQDANDRRERYPEEFPDLDFHHSFGSFLSRRNPVAESVEKDIGKYWALLNKSPVMLQYHTHDIGDRYREAFRRFFTAEPVSLHGHVSDASNPALLTSLISHLTSGYSPAACNPFVRQSDKVNPCVAILEGSYGAGYGPLAHNSVLDFVRPLANGRIPFVVNIQNPAEIETQVRKAKVSGCVALIAEIVRARDGSVMSQIAWKHLLNACNKYNLVLVVDEALTAIRCGAPFAYQLPQFRKHGFPDLVLFGKAVKTNGVAVEWRGINMLKLEITDPEERLFMALEWQERLTEMAPPASLLTSWATLALAHKENWPKRSREIGRLIRAFIQAEGINESSIAGLHSLLYLRTEDQARLRSPVMGANAGNYVRWFPTMDKVMMSKEELCKKVFGPASIKHRGDVARFLRSEGVRLGFCARCGRAVEAGLRPSSCRVCVVECCEECEPGSHVCPMGGMGG